MCEFKLKIQSGKRLNWILTCDLDLWPLTLTFCMDITSVIGNITPENFMMIYTRAVNVQSLQPEIALRNYQNTAYSSWHTSNRFQKDNDLTSVPHKVLFHVAWCNSCNVFVSLYDSKYTPFSPSNSNERLIHNFQEIGIGKCSIGIATRFLCCYLMSVRSASGAYEHVRPQR